MNQTASILGFDEIGPQANKRVVVGAQEKVSQEPSKSEVSPPVSQVTPISRPTATEKQMSVTDLDRRMHHALDAYTGTMAWAAAFFVVGGAVLISIGQIHPVLCGAMLACLMVMLVAHILRRRRVHGTLVTRGRAMGLSQSAAVAEADAKLDRMFR